MKNSRRHQLGSNHRTSDLQHSTLTTELPLSLPLQQFCFKTRYEISQSSPNFFPKQMKTPKLAIFSYPICVNLIFFFKLITGFCKWIITPSTRPIQRIMAPFKSLLHVTANRDADGEMCGTTWQRLNLLNASPRTKNASVHTHKINYTREQINVVKCERIFISQLQEYLTNS